MWKKILKNLFGKMGQRPNLRKTKVVSDPKEYFELLSNAGLEVTNANIINDEVMEMFYVMKDPFFEPSDRTLNFRASEKVNFESMEILNAEFMVRYVKILRLGAFTTHCHYGRHQSKRSPFTTRPLCSGTRRCAGLGSGSGSVEFPKERLVSWQGTETRGRGFGPKRCVRNFQLFNLNR